MKHAFVKHASVKPAPRSAQRGAVAIEFALTFLIFLTFVLGIVDFSRMLYTWNAANEALRAATRWAVVCDNTAQSATVLAKAQAMLPNISAVNVAWDPAGCAPNSCIGVRVSVTGLNYQWISPVAGLLAHPAAIAMPSFATYLTREDMRQDANAATICP